jgi:hypothetical protein
MELTRRMIVWTTVVIQVSRGGSARIPGLFINSADHTRSGDARQRRDKPQGDARNEQQARTPRRRPANRIDLSIRLFRIDALLKVHIVLL